MFGYDLVERKVYVPFGDDVVSTVEKLNIKPESINIKKPERGFQKANMVIANEFAEEIASNP